MWQTPDHYVNRLRRQYQTPNIDAIKVVFITSRPGSRLDTLVNGSKREPKKLDRVSWLGLLKQLCVLDDMHGALEQEYLQGEIY